jgi:hypothetical protein
MIIFGTLKSNFIPDVNVMDNFIRIIYINVQKYKSESHRPHVISVIIY